MENNLTVGSAVPVQDISVKISQKNFDELINAIKSIDKRLENIEKLLLQIQQQASKSDEEKTS